MIGMTRMKWPNLIVLYRLNRKDKLICTSVMATEVEEEGVKSNEIILIVLITIFMLLFFARSLTVFLVLLFTGLGIGIFWLVKRRWIKW